MSQILDNFTEADFFISLISSRTTVCISSHIAESESSSLLDWSPPGHPRLEIMAGPELSSVSSSLQQRKLAASSSVACSARIFQRTPSNQYQEALERAVRHYNMPLHGWLSTINLSILISLHLSCEKLPTWTKQGEVHSSS